MLVLQTTEFSTIVKDLILRFEISRQRSYVSFVYARVSFSVSFTAETDQKV